MSDYQQPPSVANPPPTEAQDRAATNSVGELFGELTRDLSTLVRQEVELAKAEVRESAASAGKGAGMLAGAGVAGHFVLLFLSLALMWALGSVMHLGWAAVIVAVLWGIAAAVLSAIGKKKLKEVKGLPQTTATVKKIPATMKPGEETP